MTLRDPDLPDGRDSDDSEDDALPLVSADETADFDEDDDEPPEEADEDLASPAQDEDSDQASLEELLAQRAAARRGSDETDDDGTDILALTSEKEPTALEMEPPPAKVTPIKSGQEFVCKSCFLVKPRVQLADPKRTLCRDCV